MAAIRLTFDVVGGKPTYRTASWLEMRVPPERNTAAVDKGAGLWIEVRDGKGEPVYRRLLEGETFRADTELRTGASDRPLSRRASDLAKTVFTAVIPDIPKAESFHIFERRAGVPGEAPTELARVELGSIDRPSQKGS